MPVLVSLLGIAVAGGMFVVPLYAFLTTTVLQGAGGADGGGQQHRQFGRDGARLADRGRAERRGGPAVEQLLLGAAMCLVSAWLGLRCSTAPSGRRRRRRVIRK